MSSSTANPPRIADNAGFAMSANVFYLLTRLILPPMILSYLPLAEYGLWSACFILIMYIGLTDSGFSNVYIRFAARFRAAGDTESINKLLSTGIIMLSAMTVVVLSGLWLLLPSVLAFLKVQPQQHEMASILVMGTATMFMLDLTLGAYCYLLHGLQRIREEKTVAIIGYILEPIMIYVFLRSGFGVYSLLLAFILRYVWSLSAFIRLAYRFQPGLNIGLRHFDRVMLRHFFGFGTAIQISTLIGTFLFSVDRLVAGFLLGPKGIALFELGAKLPLAAISVPSSISNVTMPAAAHHSAHDDMASIRSLYRKSSRSVSMIAGLPLAFMALFAAPLAYAWLGNRDGLSQMPLIMALTALWSQLHITTGPGSAVFRALGRAGNEFVYHGLRIAGLTACIGIALMIFQDISTALITGLSIGSAIAALIYLIHNQKQLGVKASILFQDILLPGLAAYPLAAGVYLLWQALLPSTLSQWQTLAAIAVAGLLYTGLWAGISWRFLDADERSVVRDILIRVRTRVPAWRNA